MHCQQLVSVTLSFYSQLSYFQPRFKLQGGVGWVGSLFRAKLSGKGHFSIWRRVLNWNEKWSLLKKKTIADDCLSNDPPNAKEESYKQVIFKLAKEEHKTEGTYKSFNLYIYFSSKWGKKWEIGNKCFPSGRHSLDLRDPFAVSSTGGSTNPPIHQSTKSTKSTNPLNQPNPPIHQIHQHTSPTNPSTPPIASSDS